MRTQTHAAQTRERCIAVLTALLMLTACSDETPPTSAATDVQSAGGVGNTTDAQVATLDGSSADAQASVDAAVVGDAQASVDAAVVGDAGAVADVVAAGPGSSKLIDSKGGVLQLAGVTLEVPPGALTKATTISLTAIAAPSSTVDVVFTSGGVAIHPDGLQLALPATLTMTYDPSKLTKETDEQSQFVYFIDGKTVKVAGGRGYSVEDQDVHEGPELGIDTAANKVSVRLHHFSNYAAGAVVGELKFVTQTAGADAVRVISKKTGYATAAARSKTTTHIILHHTDGTSAARLKSEFLAGWTKVAAKKASAQYWVGRNGIIAATTEPDGKVGHGPPTNSYAPGIEMLNDDTQTYPIQQVLAVRRLVGFLAGKYSLKLRGQWLADWPAAARAVPPGMDFQQTPPAASTPPKYDVVLGHREIDRHTWIVISRFLNWAALNAAPNPATHVVYMSDVEGKFYGSTGWSCGKDSLFSATVAANTEWRRAMPAPGTADLANYDRNQVHTCFRPTLQTTNVVDVTITATAQRQDASMAWIDVGGDSTVTYALNNAPSAAGDRGTVGTAAAGWTPQARAGRRRRDPGGTEVFGFEELMAGMGYAFTGIIDTSGGDSYMHKEGGKGGNVTILAAHTFAAGHFGTAEGLYLANQAPTTDEKNQTYSLVVPAGSTVTLPASTAIHNYIWVVVEGTLEVPETTEIRAAMGIYVGPKGKILARSKDDTKPDGFDLTLDTLGEALIHGVVDARGLDAKIVASAAAKGGKGGAVTIHQLAAWHTHVPSIIARGGDTDATEKAVTMPVGGNGGNVTIKTPGARVIFGGGPGAAGADPQFNDTALAPSPPMNVYTKANKYKSFSSPLAPKTEYEVFKAGICTTGGDGPCFGGIDWTVDGDAGKGGKGGNVVVEAAEIVANAVSVWTGGGLEKYFARIPLKSASGFPLFVAYTGGLGGKGRQGHTAKKGGDGGDGGDAGDITLSGTYVLTHTKNTANIGGWNGNAAHTYSNSSYAPPTQGTCSVYKATIPGAAAAIELLRVCAVGGSGGIAGGSQKQYSGDLGKAGTDGTVTGAPP